MTNTTLSSTTAPSTTSTITEPDLSEEYQASITSVPFESDLQIWRNEFVQKILEWTAKSGCPDEKEITERMVTFLPGKRIEKKSLDADQRRYERLSFSRRESRPKSFSIYGRPETEQFDRLKCWVHFNLHLMHGIWPGRFMLPKDSLGEQADCGE